MIKQLKKWLPTPYYIFYSYYVAPEQQGFPSWNPDWNQTLLKTLSWTLLVVLFLWKVTFPATYHSFEKCNHCVRSTLHLWFKAHFIRTKLEAQLSCSLSKLVSAVCHLLSLLEFWTSLFGGCFCACLFASFCYKHRLMCYTLKITFGLKPECHLSAFHFMSMWCV